MEPTRETDHLVTGTFIGMLASAATLPLVGYVMSEIGKENILMITGSTLTVLSVILLLPPLYKLIRGERRLSIEEDVRSLKATMTGRAVGLVLGLVLGAPAIALWR